MSQVIKYIIIIYRVAYRSIKLLCTVCVHILVYILCMYVYIYREMTITSGEL